MITQNHIDTLLGNGGNVVGSDGEKIGSIGQVYLDDQTGEPSWVTAKTGLFGTSESFVPLQGADVEGHDVRVPYSKHQVKDAPRVESDGNLSPEEEDRLYRHYEIGGGTSGYSDTTTTSGTSGTSGYSDTTTSGTVGQGDRDVDIDTTSGRHSGRTDTDASTRSNTSDTRGTVGHDTSGPTTDEAMTRSEEQLRVGTERREVGSARLRKYVVTENVTQTVPVSREEVRVEREPITDANRDNAYDGPAISEEEHEVTLHAERPVVDKEAVPVERVRLDKETVTSNETVSGEVRKEEIEVEGADDTRRGNNL
ncbi:MAG: Photosystem reaction center subunit [Micrococcaceae bacterium]|nr:Photosystem reaction center subunit [Micrococcaceae bacterium]